MKEWALRMFAEHRQDYPSDSALAEAVAKKVDVGRETVRRWLVQADINAGARPGVTSSEQVEIRQLKAEVKRLREDNEICVRPRFSSRQCHPEGARRGSLVSSLPRGDSWWLVPDVRPRRAPVVEVVA